MWSKFGLLCILFSFVALSVGSALSESMTYDEVFYLEEGRRIVTARTFSDPYNPPLAPLLAAIPGVFGWAAPTAARWVTIGIGVLLILAAYQVGVRALGRVGGLVAATILAFDPTILAHSHYITNDSTLTLFVFLAAIAWNRYLMKPTQIRLMLVGLGVGYALATKMTALPYVGIAFMTAWWWQRPRRGWHWMMRRRLALLGSVMVALFVVWSSYFFTWDTIIKEREDPGRASSRLVAYTRARDLPVLESAVTFLIRQPLPLGTYAATLKNNILRMGKPSAVFFDGEMYDRSRWYFMVVNGFRKTPIPLLILLVVGIWGAIDRKDRQRRFVWIVLASGLGMILFASFIGMVPLVRYVLPAMPFLALVGAAGVEGIRAIKGKMIAVALLLWYIGGTVVQYPHFISYANEFVGPRDRRYEVLGDSNLDWGQAIPDVAKYAVTKKFGKVRFSYFGRDDAGRYGLPSITPYGSWRFEEICAFHDVALDEDSEEDRTVISVSNWYSCGYDKQEAYRKEKIRDVVAEVFLVF